jgi:hypothetical protein
MYTLILIILISDGHLSFDISRPTVPAVKFHQWDISHRLKNTVVRYEDSHNNDIIRLHSLRRTSKIDVTGGGMFRTRGECESEGGYWNFQLLKDIFLNVF